ncbi:hypothetical protein RHMOL_Rhmol05G0192000 [Rhododendron molle]|uniref:Uncharacterized protein n=1 Tax=Rhododendron molle TaxID=49168 RepID=A0ACC0NSV1_RHOML|nr:hypothetical protein RHMOL_Rhmol05G0192000 [Rhododendron molle]
MKEQTLAWSSVTASSSKRSRQHHMTYTHPITTQTLSQQGSFIGHIAANEPVCAWKNYTNKRRTKFFVNIVVVQKLPDRVVRLSLFHAAQFPCPKYLSLVDILNLQCPPVQRNWDQCLADPRTRTYRPSQSLLQILHHGENSV